MTPEHIEPIELAADKLEAHYRQQLSAMMDGALAPDQARFLLRRLQHDRELGDCWERWQLCGEVLRGRANVLLPPDFAHRVAAAIATGSPAVAAAGSNHARRRWTGWGGGAALAASMALVALLVVRQEPQSPGAPATASGIATTRPAPMPVRPPPLAPAPASPSATGPADPSATAVAVAGTARTTSERRPRGQGRRVASIPPPAPQPTVIDVASSAGPGANQEDPFATRATPAPARPWPRAVLPDTATGAFNADYGNASVSPSFHPFEPRLPPEAGADGDGVP